MGRMKDKFIEEQERQLSENTFEWDFTPNDDCCEQQCGCHEENKTNAEASAAYAAEYDAWWDSLTDDQKEQLFKDRDASEREMTDEDFFGPNKTAGVK